MTDSVTSHKNMFIFLTFTVLVSVTTAKLGNKFAHPLSDEFINYINSVQNSWTAGRNFHPKTSMDYLKKLQGVIPSNNTNKLPLKWHEIEDNEKLPEDFDARIKWPNCKSLKEIRDQGACGSSWAMAAAAAMTDRVCIHSGGKQNFHFSAVDLLSCCDSSGDEGCQGGNSYDAWYYYKENGIVSGGNFNSSTGCRPYPYRNCNHYQAGDDGYPDCSNVKEERENCKRRCITDKLDYKKDLKKAEAIYYMAYDVEQMKQEIYKNGPVQADFTVYEDFLSYKKGVYRQTAGNEIAHQAVKIIGWGVENNQKYWLIANSWNEHWGDNGLFKIVRGENHCGIEGFINAGIPLLDVDFLSGE